MWLVALLMPADAVDLILPKSAVAPASGGIAGVLVDGTFWYWQQPIDEASIGYARVLGKARRLVRYMAGTAGVLLVLGAVVSGVNNQVAEIFTLDFWITPSWMVAAVDLALLLWLYVLYRLKNDQRKQVSLKPFGQVAPAELASIPSPAAAQSTGDIAEVVDEEALQAVQDAYRLAVVAGHSQVTALHLFTGTLTATPVQILFARLGLSLEAVRDPLRRRLASTPSGITSFGTVAQDIMAKAMYQALNKQRTTLSALEIFEATVAAEPFLVELFASQAITLDELNNAVAWLRISDDLRFRYQTFRKAAAYKPTSNMNRAMTAVATPFLDSVSLDLTRAAVQGQTGMLVGREIEMANILRAIEGGDQSVVLVGQPGVGKEAIIDGLADLMVEERVPAVLQDKRLLKLSVPHIVSAEGGTGADERFLFALNQVARAGNIILVIENIHELVGPGSGIDLASILAGELNNGYTFVIATTTPQAYTEIVERSVISPKLQKISLDEPNRNEAIRILEAKVGAIEAKHKVIFTYAALAAAVDLSTRYLHEMALPEKAIELIKEAALVVSKTGNQQAWVKKEDVAALIANRTHVPVTEVSVDEGEKLLHLEERVHERVIGQVPAVKAVASALRRARTELRSGKRPIANFLFLGPTGVGKTELAKATAEVYFGNEQSMIRFDMSEYQDQSSISRLIGVNGQAGLMTEAVRKNPFCLLLLDELEKAHPDILNLFLQVMDDGRLTDGLGRTIDFTNVILIATSNAGTTFIQDQVAARETLETIKQALLDRELRQTYRPEFLNRFDDVIVFAPLTLEDVVAIAYVMITKIVERLKAKGIEFSVTDAAVHELAAQGYDPKFGARPLRRVLQDKIENQLADYLLQGKVARRDSLVFDVGGKIILNKAAEL